MSTPCPYRAEWEDAVRKDELLKSAPVPDRDAINKAHRQVMVSYAKWYINSSEPEAVAERTRRLGLQ